MRLQREYIKEIRLYLADERYFVDGSKYVDITIDDDAKLVRTAMSFDNSLTLKWDATQDIKVRKGSYVIYDGNKYTFLDDADYEKNGSRDYRHKLILRDSLAIAKYTLLKNTSDNRLVFEYTGTVAEHLSLVIDSLNRNHGKRWSLDPNVSAMSSEEQMIPYSYNYCSDAIQTITTQFNVEFYTTESDGQIVVRLRNFDSLTLPTLKYGKDGGLRPGIKSTSNAPKPTKMHVIGGERNIDLSKYGYTTLQLPSVFYGRYFYDGKYHYNLRKEYDAKENFTREVLYRWDEQLKQLSEFESSNIEDAIDISRLTEYIRPVSSDYVMMADSVNNPAEIDIDSYTDGSHIYPSYTCTVTGVETEEGSVENDDGTKAPALFFNIVDSNIPEDIDYSKCVIEGEIATIIFQTGMLAGREFQIETDKNGKLEYNHSTRTFKLVTEVYDGLHMPSWEKTESGELVPGKFSPAIGDKFNVYGVSLPYGYINGGATMQGASWDLWRHTVEALYNEWQIVDDVKIEIDKLYLKTHWADLYDKLDLGKRICIEDDVTQYTITSITETLSDPYNIVCELKNGKVRNSKYTRFLAKNRVDNTIAILGLNSKVSSQKFKTRNNLENKFGQLDEQIGSITSAYPIYFDFSHTTTPEGEVTQDIEIVDANEIEFALRQLDSGRIPFARISNNQKVEFSSLESEGSIIPIEIASWNNDSEYLRAVVEFDYNNRKYTITVDQELEPVVSLTYSENSNGGNGGTITSDRIGSRAVTSDKIALEAVLTEHIKPHAITEECISTELQEKINADNTTKLWKF